jgi:outer membrane biosynthesis protein TonB
MVVGVGLFGGMMDLMGGDMLAAIQEAQKQPSAPAAKPPPKKSAAAAPAKPAAPAPSAPVAQPAADMDTLLAARLSGIDRPGTTRAGPAILELDSLFGGSFTIKTYLPLYKEFDGNGMSVQLTRVVDAKGAELYDPKHNLESAFFQRVSVKSESSPVPHLAGSRSVHLKSGVTSTGLERAEGVVKLALPVKPATVSFDTGADLGKQHTAHGVGITLKGMKGNAYTFEYKGDQARIVATNGVGADQNPVALTGRSGGGNFMTYTFAGAVSRIDVVVAETLSEHAFPFTLTRTSLAGPATAPQPLAVKTTTPAAAPSEPAKASLPAKPLVLAQAKPEAAKETPKPMAAEPAKTEPAKAEKPKPVARKPRPKPDLQEVAKEASAPVQAAPAPARIAAAPSVATPRFNDLMTAVLYRDAKAVEELIAHGKWVDKPDSRGMTPLQLAASLGDAPIATVLLKAGANPNRPGPGGETALAIARERNDAAMLGLLKQYGGR